MGLFAFFQKKPPASANLAKERLKIIVEHSRSSTKRPDFLQKMRQEIMEVVKKYVDIELNDIQTNIASKGESEILELNITLPDKLVSTKGPTNTHGAVIDNSEPNHTPARHSGNSSTNSAPAMTKKHAQAHFNQGAHKTPQQPK